MKRHVFRQFVIVSFISLTLAASASAQQRSSRPKPGTTPDSSTCPRPPSDSEPIELELRTLTHGGVTRAYRLFVPSQASESRRRPLVVVFHGGGGTPLRMADITRMHVLGAQGSFFVAYPAARAPARLWNDGRDYTAGVDDVGFVDAMLAELVSQYPVDADRVYATGASNGGMFVLRLACERADSFRAFAPVIANFPVEYVDKCDPGRPVPIAFFHGLDDTLMPYNGGDVGGSDAIERGQVLSAPASVAFWTDNNDCTLPAKAKALTNCADDGTTVELLKCADCSAAEEVRWYKVIGGGHRWPGTTVPPAFPAAGLATQDIDASAEIVKFFNVK